MGDCYVLGFASPPIFTNSKILYRLKNKNKRPSDETTMCIRMQKDHIRTLKMLQSMSELGGLWKNHACTKSINNLRNVEGGHSTEVEEEKTMMVMMTKKCTKTN